MKQHFLRYEPILQTSIALVVAGLLGCTPRVEVALPDKPIEININAKIEHEVRVKIEREISQVVKANNELF